MIKISFMVLLLGQQLFCMQEDNFVSEDKALDLFGKVYSSIDRVKLKLTGKISPGLPSGEKMLLEHTFERATAAMAFVVAAKQTQVFTEHSKMTQAEFELLIEKALIEGIFEATQKREIFA